MSRIPAPLQIFEPLYTTRRDRTGQGPAVRHRIVTGHRAEVRFAAQSVAGDAADYTGVSGDAWAVEPELLTPRSAAPSWWSLTAGRQNLGYGDGLLVATTAPGACHKHEALESFGADDYLAKPPAAKALFDVLERVLR